MAAADEVGETAGVVAVRILYNFPLPIDPRNVLDLISQYTGCFFHWYPPKSSKCRIT